MTTTITVRSHNHPAMVTYVDRVSGAEIRTQGPILFPEDGKQSFYCTTTRTVEVVDLEYDDPRIAEWKASPGGSGERRLSYGQKAVGLSFEPSDNPDGDAFKEVIAEFIDYCHARRENAINPEIKRMYSIAITEAQGAQMWAVKAANWTG
jgi:hypothetical protein